MLVAMGWIKIQPSFAPYCKVDNLNVEKVDRLDEQMEKEEKKLHEDFQAWMEKADPWLMCNSVGTNNHFGYFQIFTSRNHRTSSLWDMMDFIARQSKGSHGLIYTHDDEHSPKEYKVWRIFDGKVTEHSDSFFSPFSSPHAFGDLLE